MRESVNECATQRVGKCEGGCKRARKTVPTGGLTSSTLRGATHRRERRISADDLDNLTYGKSITDACINWQDTKDCLHRLAESVKVRNK